MKTSRNKNSRELSLCTHLSIRKEAPRAPGSAKYKTLARARELYEMTKSRYMAPAREESTTSSRSLQWETREYKWRMYIQTHIHHTRRLTKAEARSLLKRYLRYARAYLLKFAHSARYIVLSSRARERVFVGKTSRRGVGEFNLWLLRVDRVWRIINCTNNFTTRSSIAPVRARRQKVILNSRA